MEKIKFIRFGGLSPQIQVHRKDRLNDFKNDENGEFYFHTPPRKKGVFAFPYGYVSMFLLGATYHPSNSSGKSAWLKDENGELISTNDNMDFKYIGVGTGKKEVNVFSPKVTKILKKLNIKGKYVWSSKLTTDNFDCPKDDVECEQCEIEAYCNEQRKEYLVYLKNPHIFEYNGELWHHLTSTTKPEQIIEKFGSWVKTTYEDYIIAFDKNRHNLLKECHKDMRQYDKIQNLNAYKGRNNPYNKSPYMHHCKDELEVFIEKIK